MPDSNLAFGTQFASMTLRQGSDVPTIYQKANLAWKTAIRACREKAGLDQEALAKLVKMNQQDISKIETGRRPLRAAEIAVFAKAFDISPAKLFETFLVFYDT